MQLRATALCACSSTPLFVGLVLGLFACGDGPSAGTGAGGAGATGSVSASSSSVTTTVSAGAGAMGGGLPEVFVVSGVVTDGLLPVEGATVMQGGGEPSFVTGPDGAFSIEITQSIPGAPTLVAGKAGYRSAGIEILDLADGPYTLVLKAITTPDNAGYVFQPPGTGDPEKDNSTAVCGHCHTTFVAEFLTSAHARASRDPLVWDLYTGSASGYADEASCIAAQGVWKTGLLPGSGATPASRCYLGPSVLSDLNGCGKAGALGCDDPALPAAERPTQFGGCADCHAAGLDGKLGGRDLLEATGIAYENGNHCDVCHKIRDIDLAKPPGTAGRLLMQRPKETMLEMSGEKPVQAMYGPFLDVPNQLMGGSEAPVFTKSQFCAGCHEQAQAALLPGSSLDPRFPLGVPIHSTYSEWQSSAWAAVGADCQHCHMPPLDGLVNSLDVTKPEKAGLVYGFARPSERTRSHRFRGPLAGNPRLLDTALGFWLDAKPQSNGVDVSIVMRNEGAGHALPTGEPMRALLLLVRAEACGTNLVQQEGPTMPDLGGALAEGIIGQAITTNAQTWDWAEAAAIAKPGQVVRVVRETGEWEDDPGFGYFGDPARTAPEKGIPRRAFVGEAKILNVAGSTLALDQAIAVMPGDRVFLGDAWASPMDGAPSLALAGSAGRAFARVLSNANGNRQVAQHEASGLESDNRLLPFQPVQIAMRFAMPMGCTEAKVEAIAVYRPLPLSLARAKGAEAKDFIVGKRVETITGF